MLNIVDYINVGGSVAILSSYSLDFLAELLSKEVFNNAQFGGKELKIRDEFDAVFIKDYLGFRIILMDNAKEKYDDLDKELFWLTFDQKVVYEDSFNKTSLNGFLYELFKKKLESYLDIIVIKTPIDKEKYPNLI